MRINDSGKEKNLIRKNVLELSTSMGIPGKVSTRVVQKMLGNLPVLRAPIRKSFLPANMQEDLIGVMEARAARLAEV